MKGFVFLKSNLLVSKIDFLNDKTPEVLAQIAVVSFFVSSSGRDKKDITESWNTFPKKLKS